MIDVLNEEITKFLSSLSNIEKNSLSKIKKSYSSTVTDDLSKGHLTTNVCMIAASELKRNPKELANELQKELSDSNKFEIVEALVLVLLTLLLKEKTLFQQLRTLMSNLQALGHQSMAKINQYRLNLSQRIQQALFMLVMAEELHTVMLLEESLNLQVMMFKKNIT